MNKEFNLKGATDVELKAFVYDQMKIIEQAQNNIRIMNQELNQRNESIPKDNGKVKEKKEEVKNARL